MKHLLTLLFVFVTTFTWSQKKELKQAQKLFKSAKISEAKASKKDILFDQPERLVQRELELKAVEGINGPSIIVGSLDEVSTSGNWPRQYAINRRN